MHCVWENYSHFVSEWQYLPKNQNSNRTFSFLIYVCLPILPSIISLSIFVICVKNLRNNPMHITYRQYTTFQSSTAWHHHLREVCLPIICI